MTEVGTGQKPTLVDETRIEIAAEAIYETQVLALMLRSVIGREKVAVAAEVAAAARGILTRISDLSDILFEAVIQEHGERHSIQELRRKLGEGGG